MYRALRGGSGPQTPITQSEIAAAISTTPSQQGAGKLRKVVDRALKTPYQRNQERTHTPPTETSFWAMLAGTADLSDLRYNFIRVNPVASRDRADFTLGDEMPLFYEIAGDQVEEGYAREANGSKSVPTMTAVKVEFIGYDADDLPAYLFTWANTTIDAGVAPHDHRSNLDEVWPSACSIRGLGCRRPRLPFNNRYIAADVGNFWSTQTPYGTLLATTPPWRGWWAMARRYPDSDVKMLFARSAGRCAYPGCRKECIQDGTSTDRQKVIGKIAHIVAHSDGGPRSDPKMKPEDRDCYENWVLLCPTCHDIVDGQPNHYSVDKLKAWKAAVEKWVTESLAKSISQVTFAELETACGALMAPPADGNTDYRIIDIREKIKKNSLSQAVHNQLAMGTALNYVVEKFIHDMTKLDMTYADRLKAGFVAHYQKLKTAGTSGDGLFYSMQEFASGGSGEMRRISAGLAVLSYFFTICDIFEK